MLHTIADAMRTIDAFPAWLLGASLVTTFIAVAGAYRRAVSEEEDPHPEPEMSEPFGADLEFTLGGTPYRVGTAPPQHLQPSPDRPRVSQPN